MLRQIKITTMSNTFKLFPTKWKFILNITTPFCIVSKLIGCMRTRTNPILIQAKHFIKAQSTLNPCFKKLIRLFALAEKLHLHLLKFTHTEEELAWSNFVTKCLTNLRNTKRNFYTIGRNNIFKVD